MSKAITLTKNDIAYLKFGGASKYRKHLETVRVKHEPLGVNFFPAIPFESNTTSLFIGHGETSVFTPQQADALQILKEAASELGYKIEVDEAPNSKNSPARLLLKHDRPFTFDDIFEKPFSNPRELVYLKKKDRDET